jgi:hypothetical protein
MLSLEIVAKQLDDKTSKEKIFNIPLSQSTVRRCNEELATDMTNDHKVCAALCSYFSLALDKSMNIYDIDQLCTFIRTNHNKCYVTEELLGLEPLHSITNN